MLAGLFMAERALPEGEAAGWAVAFLGAGARVACETDPGPLFGLALGLRLLHAGGWLEERPGRQGEIMGQLLAGEPASLAAWEWPEDALAAWHRGLAARWERHVDAPLGQAVPERFRSARHASA